MRRERAARLEATMPNPLDDHRIAEVRAYQPQGRYPRTIGRNARLGSHGIGPRSQVRVLVTDQGASGWGLSGRPDLESPNLIGRRVADLIHPA